jgi:hypothetical protein
MTIWRMPIACGIRKFTNIFKYAILMAFTLRQGLKERASILRYTYIACLAVH